jgi:hypothetical protein
MNAENLKKEIKGLKLKHVALLCTGVFLAFAIIGSILFAAGGGFNWAGGMPLLGFGALHEVDDVKPLDLSGVDALMITSVSDGIAVQTGQNASAELKGQCSSAGDPVYLQTRRDGNTLRVEVKYPSSISNSNTMLTVTLPQSYQGDFTVNSVSGGIRSTGLPNAFANVTLGTVSGQIDFSSAAFASLKASSTSGEISISDIAASTAVHTISGGVLLDYAEMAATTVGTVSGGVKAEIPSTSAFSVDFGTLSGSFRSTHPGLHVNEAERGFKSSAENAPLLKVNTTSGDFTITGK